MNAVSAFRSEGPPCGHTHQITSLVLYADDATIHPISEAIRCGCNDKAADELSTTVLVDHSDRALHRTVHRDHLHRQLAQSLALGTHNQREAIYRRKIALGTHRQRCGYV